MKVSWIMLPALVLGCASEQGQRGPLETGGADLEDAAPETAGVAGATPATGGGAGAGGGALDAAAEVDASASLPHGYKPATVSDRDADAAYASFKASFLENCNDGSWRVRWEDPTVTVSEGIAYGMLLTVVHDDRSIFDGLWQYYQHNADKNGLMHWRRTGCPGSQSGDNAATDADLDAAMALVMASRRWSTTPYLAAAQTLVGAIRSFETMAAPDGLALLKPGDMFGGADCINVSYFAPAYYRVFAEIEPAQAAFWTKLAADSYAVIARVANVSTGLVANWCDENGNSNASGAPGCQYYSPNGNIFGSDAVRAPWRIATDYVWYGTAEAQAWLGKLTGFAKGIGIANISKKYQLDGTLVTPTVHSVIAVGAFADAAIAYDQQTVDEFFAEVAAMPVETGYFTTCLRALYVLLPMGRFTPY
jgi:endo-1,4-beta-D-glucanase Y